MKLDGQTRRVYLPSEDASVGMSKKPLILVGDVSVAAVETAENSGKTGPGSGTTLVKPVIQRKRRSQPASTSSTK